MSLDNPSTVTCEHCSDAPLTVLAGTKLVCGPHADLPGVVSISVQYQGTWIAFGALGSRPLYDEKEQDKVMRLLGYEPEGLHKKAPHLVSQVTHKDFNGFRTWWYALTPEDWAKFKGWGHA